MKLANLIENQTTEITNLMEDWKRVIYSKYFARYEDITIEDLVVQLKGSRKSQRIELQFCVGDQTITLYSGPINPISTLDQALTSAGNQEQPYYLAGLNSTLKVCVTGSEHLCTEAWSVRASLCTLKSVIIKPESIGAYLYTLLDDEESLTVLDEESVPDAEDL